MELSSEVYTGNTCKEYVVVQLCLYDDGKEDNTNDESLIALGVQLNYEDGVEW